VITFLLILLTLFWCVLAFSLFAGADFLAARLRGREATFDWFDHTRWSGRSSPGKQRAVLAMTYLSGALIVAGGATLVLGLLGLALDPLLPDEVPRPPARPR
jgi:hypothetical protein